MIIYIVTESDHYYPMPGDEDWLLVTTNEDAAVSFYAGLEARDPEERDNSSVHLIKIDTDNLPRYKER